MATDYAAVPFAEWTLPERAAYVIGCFGWTAQTRQVALEVNQPTDVARSALQQAQAEGLAARLPFDRWRLTRKAHQLWPADL